jgi:hypothetical protein
MSCDVCFKQRSHAITQHDAMMHSMQAYETMQNTLKIMLHAQNTNKLKKQYINKTRQII